MNTKTHNAHVIAAFSSLIIILTCILTHIYRINKLNTKTHYTNGLNKLAPAYADIYARTGESWVKRDVLVGDSTTPCNLTGTVYDVSVYNQDSAKITDWSLKIKIDEDCYINQDWCGTVEIHQIRTGEFGEPVETSQRLALKSDMSSKLSSIYLEYCLVGQDLLIPLKAGDYVIYYPDADANELPIEAAKKDETSSITAGIIFYYGNNDFVPNNYQLIYECHKGYFKGLLANFYLMLAILWGILFFSELVAFISSYQTKKALQQQISGLSAMSGIYDHIFSVELGTGLVTEVPGSKNAVFHFEKNENVFEKLLADCDDNFTEILETFLDLKTLAKRLEEHSSVLCEYKHKSYGWCSIRFHIMDRSEDGKINRVLCTIQIIEEERKNREQISASIEKIANESRAKSAALDKLTEIVMKKLLKMLDADNLVLKDNQQENLNQPLKLISSEAQYLLALSGAEKDFLKLKDSRDDELKSFVEDYKFTDLIDQITDLLKPELEDKAVEFKLDTSKKIDFTLNGDFLRLKTVLYCVLYNLIEKMEKGTLTLGAFAKEEGDQVNLMFTITQTGDCPKLDGSSPSAELYNGILKLYNSQLKVVSIENQRNDIYFSLKQKLVK